MSSGGALVRFSDGYVARTTYHGTSDILNGVLLSDVTGFPLLWDVEIWTNYGGGFWWCGLATKTEVTPGSCCPGGIEDMGGQGIYPRIKIHDGDPDWVVSYWEMQDA